MKQLIRCTTATRAKIVNIKRLIDCMRDAGVMRLDDIMVLLGFSASGARKYTHELVGEGVLKIHGFDPAPPKCRIGKTIYALNKDQRAIDAFYERLALIPVNLTERRAKADHSAGPRMQKLQVEAGRQVHMLRDDVEHKPRSARFKIPAPDPVLAAFYGFAGAESMCG
jgi:hypothetical protein